MCCFKYVHICINTIVKYEDVFKSPFVQRNSMNSSKKFTFDFLK